MSCVGCAIVTLCACWYLTAAINRCYYGRMIVSSLGKAVLITGCDSGFGHLLAKKLNKLGFTVIAACLDSKASEKLVLETVFPQRMLVTKLDVTRDQDVQNCYDAVVQMLHNNGIQLWAIVNNAGVFDAGFSEWGNMDSYARAINVNTLGCVRVTRQFLPLIRRSKGRVINVTSVAARLSMPGYGAYCMSKHATQAFNDTLRKEMRAFGVNVISIEPSCYRYLQMSLF